MLLNWLTLRSCQGLTRMVLHLDYHSFVLLLHSFWCQHDSTQFITITALAARWSSVSSYYVWLDATTSDTASMTSKSEFLSNDEFMKFMLYRLVPPFLLLQCSEAAIDKGLAILRTANRNKNRAHGNRLQNGSKNTLSEQAELNSRSNCHTCSMLKHWQSNHGSNGSLKHSNVNNNASPGGPNNFSSDLSNFSSRTKSSWMKSQCSKIGLLIWRLASTNKLMEIINFLHKHFSSNSAQILAVAEVIFKLSMRVSVTLNCS